MNYNSIQFGLCCIFLNEPIKYRKTTATSLQKLSRIDQLSKLSSLIKSNIDALDKSIQYCSANSIGSFRISSDFFPVMSHPSLGYNLEDLPGGQYLIDNLKNIGQKTKQANIRLVLHPDQFVVLNTPFENVWNSSLQDLQMHTLLAKLVGVNTIIIHGGGVYGDKQTSLSRLLDRINKLPIETKSLIAIENDDRSFTPSNLITICQEACVPMVYDVHHHRCNSDGLSIEDATRIAMSTWIDRKPLFHLSSPRDGWHSKNPRSHHDYIDIADWPHFWNGLDVTIEVEAKAKELAIAKLKKDLSNS